MRSEPESLTWATLLAHFTALAKASLALPRDAAGDRWRTAVPSIISLQAVTHALQELDSFPVRTAKGKRRVMDAAERAVALDKAAMLIARDSRALSALWGKEPVHEAVEELQADATMAFAEAMHAGYQWYVAGEVLVAEHPADLVEALLEAGFQGDLYVPSPGVPLFQTCPAAWIGGGPGLGAEDEEELEGGVDDAMVRLISEFLGDVSEPSRGSRPVLAYRQFDFSRGGPVRDVAVRQTPPHWVEDGELMEEQPAGQALLVAAIVAGEGQAVSLPPRKAPPLTELLPVVFEDEA